MHTRQTVLLLTAIASGCRSEAMSNTSAPGLDVRQRGQDMKVSKIRLNNLRSILNRVGELDDDIQNTLFDINERETEELHYQLMDIADRIEAEIEILEVDNPELAS
jgi:hypothetical protein